MARSSTSGQGRPRGVPNKTTRTVREAFEHAFRLLQSDDRVNLRAWAERNPTDFYKLCGKLIPTEISGTSSVTLTVVTGVPDVDARRQ